MSSLQKVNPSLGDAMTPASRHVWTPEYTAVSTPVQGGPALESVSLTEFLSILYRYKWRLLLAVLIGGLLALLASALQKPSYMAVTTLEIQAFYDGLPGVGGAPAPGTPAGTEPDLQTQAEILREDSIIEEVVLTLRLHERQEFTSRFSALDQPRSLFGFGERQEVSRLEQATRTVKDNLTIEPVEKSRIIHLTFRSSDRHLAAAVPNTLVDIYVHRGRQARREANENVSKWLQPQLETLKKKLDDSDQQLQAFTNQSGLVVTKGDTSVAGAKLKHVQEEYSKARADRIAKQSLYETAIRYPAESMPPSFDTTVTRELQVRLADLRRQMAELGTMLKPENYKVTRVQAQVEELETALSREYSAIRDRMYSEYQAAQSREQMLLQAMEGQVAQVSDESQKTRKYEELAREVALNREVYETTLRKAKEVGVASMVSPSNVRVVSEAKPPTRPYKPKPLLYVTIGLVTGLIAGLGLVVYKAQSDRRLTAPGEAEAYLSVPELGAIPKVSRGALSRGLRGHLRAAGNGRAITDGELNHQVGQLRRSFGRTLRSAAGSVSDQLKAGRDLAERAASRGLREKSLGTAVTDTWRIITSSWRNGGNGTPGQTRMALKDFSQTLWQTLTTGASTVGHKVRNYRNSDRHLALAMWEYDIPGLSESFRATLTSILSSGMGNRQNRLGVLVFTSAVPGEGKTTVSCNLAIALAEINRKVLLIDGDMRKPKLHEMFGLQPNKVLADVLSPDTNIEQLDLTEYAVSTPVPNLYLVSSCQLGEGAPSLFYSDHWNAFIERARQQFDHVIIDAPPSLLFADARIAAKTSDGVVLVLRADYASWTLALAAVQRLQSDGVPLIGAVLNAWNPRVRSDPYGYHELSKYYRAG